MWLLMVEAGVALFLLVFIVWWTMYADPRPTHTDKDAPKPGKFRLAEAVEAKSETKPAAEQAPAAAAPATEGA